MIPFPREFIVCLIVLIAVILLSGCANTIGHFGSVDFEPKRSLADARREVVNQNLRGLTRSQPELHPGRTFGRF